MSKASPICSCHLSFLTTPPSVLKLFEYANQPPLFQVRIVWSLEVGKLGVCVFGEEGFKLCQSVFKYTLFQETGV